MTNTKQEQIRKYLADADTRQTAQVDTATGAHTIIDSDHRYIHEGKKFSAVVEQALARDETYKLSFISPSVVSGKYAHWRPALISSSSSLLIVRLYENITSTDGTPVTSVNANRISTTTASTVVKKGVTADVSAATPIAIFSVGSGGTPQSQAGGAVSADEEIVLKRDTEYIMEIEEPNVAATTVYVHMKWYEEES